MKKIYRLQKSWEFDEIIKKKNQIVNKYLVLYFAPAKDFKVGITVPKKFCGAFWRNYYKRQLKAIIHSLNVYDIKYHCVLILRKEFLNETYSEKYDATMKMFKKLKK
ncbi:ribonuclease P protein component [Mycoplasmopsis felifaucium]|uniref:Ribonuclease P protein component n=1 Tax=Mycoplasmopsis felifaucium TaxID=35768 RepID=A0ABZ2RPX4_9BACT